MTGVPPTPLHPGGADVAQRKEGKKVDRKCGEIKCEG